ncbi:MAG TPA: hypothetical protein VNO24_04170 [Blastocatellia bacterium]|nr:hypothetical protein [Blastocatellia bacterium]
MLATINDKMTSRQNKTAVALRLFAIYAALSFAQTPTNASEVISPQDTHAPESRVVLEVILTCHGMCGTAPEARFRLLDDATGEYLVLKSKWSEPDKDDIILKKSINLTKDEYDPLINLAESRQFLESAPAYDSKLSFVDSWFLISVTYKNSGKLKKIYLKNYFPSAKRSAIDPPDEVRQLIERVYELSDKIRKNGT